jgi:hypothetical protein
LAEEEIRLRVLLSVEPLKRSGGIPQLLIRFAHCWFPLVWPESIFALSDVHGKTVGFAGRSW